MEEKKKFSGIKNIYEKQYKKLLIIPFLILFLALAQIAYQYSATGDFLNRGVSLRGGITITIPEKVYDVQVLEDALTSELAATGGDAAVRKISQTGGILIDASDSDLITLADRLMPMLEQHLGTLTEEDYSVENIGASLGASFFRETFLAILLAFVFMGIVVFITYRTIAPSMAVILAAFSDIVVTLAIFNLTGIKLGTAGIAAFLMLIGYSVDTDILLSTRVLKRKEGTVMERVYGAIKTGLTMSATTIVALIVGLIMTQSETIRQIMIILLIGLFVDLIMTWIQNVGLIRIYLEKKHGSHEHP